jgi:hypothetical protein
MLPCACAVFEAETDVVPIPTATSAAKSPVLSRFT